MTWTGDKKEVLSRIVDLYQEIESSINRYDASLVLLNQTDFFINKLMEDPAIVDMLSVDKEWFRAYFTSMSDLMGEEK